MGRSNRDVGGYRGRRTITDILRGIAIVLAVAVVLVLAGVLYLQRYLVYTDDGVKLDLPPFLQMFRQEDGEQGGSASPPELPDISLTEDPDASQPEPEPEPEPPGFALSLAVDEIVNGTAAVRLEETGAQAVILEVKDRMGQLSWPSEQTIAGWSHVNGQQAAADALRQWNQGEVYTIARVHCFRDDTVPYYNNRLALRWAGTEWNWRDELGLRWTSPAQEDIRAYNAALCGELAAMGFDEIVLEEFYFPVTGKLDTIRRGDSYNPSQFTAQVEDFLTRAQQAAEPYGAKISLRIPAGVLGEGSAASGLTPEMLERFGYRIWGDREGLSALPELEGERMVQIVPQAEENRELFQAVIPQPE
ncbi:MAG: hypothetical protein HFF44_03605 [Lawsonibacter sp.]|nr:hypothetical protein [Lawsonibacter sp.]